MADNIKGIPFSSEDEGRDFIKQAKAIVQGEYNEVGIGTPKGQPIDLMDLSEIYVVWFTYVLGNWKAILSTSRPDGRIWEITRDKPKGEIYVDSYLKTHNRVIVEV